MRVGIIVNPDAGLGGRLGFKGSDGRAAEAREAGAQDRAGPRMTQCMIKFDELLKSSLNRSNIKPVSYTHLRAHETSQDLVCRLLLEKKKCTN